MTLDISGDRPSAMISAALVTLHSVAHPWAVTMTLALFAVRITYKTATVWAIGPTNPVVITNTVVIGVQISAVAMAWRAGLLAA